MQLWADASSSRNQRKMIKGTVVQYEKDDPRSLEADLADFIKLRTCGTLSLTMSVRNTNPEVAYSSPTRRSCTEAMKLLCRAAATILVSEQAKVGEELSASVPQSEREIGMSSSFKGGGLRFQG